MCVPFWSNSPIAITHSPNNTPIQMGEKQPLVNFIEFWLATQLTPPLPHSPTLPLSPPPPKGCSFLLSFQSQDDWVIVHTGVIALGSINTPVLTVHLETKTCKFETPDLVIVHSIYRDRIIKNDT